MAKILDVYLMPHPPLIVPEVGKGKEKKIQQTITALEYCCKTIKEKAPRTIVIITPHGNILDDSMLVMAKEKLEGNLSRFGAPAVSESFENDINLVNEVIVCANKRRIPCVGLDDELAFEFGVSTFLDWGALVPLYYVVKQYEDFKLVYIAVSMLSYEDLYEFGICVQEAIESTNYENDAVIICSGDLSHVLKEDGPYGYNPAGAKLDRNILDLLNNSDVEGFFNLDRTIVEKGKECALRPLIMGLGTLEGYSFKPRILSYEGPFGVGYAVAQFEPVAKTTDRNLIHKLYRCQYGGIADQTAAEDSYVSLARQSLEHYLMTAKILKFYALSLPYEMLNSKAGVFVSIKKKGKLRGCIGTIDPIRENIAEEIIYNAISAGTEDNRFEPIERSELAELTISVDVLSQPRKVSSLSELDAKKYGVIVRSGRRTGLLLPDIEGVNTPQEQIEIALGKANIGIYESYTIECFDVERHI